MKINKEYYQANALVQARTKNYDIVEHRLFRMAVADLNPKLKNSKYYNEEFPTFHLSTDEVIKEFGEEKNDHRLYEKLLMAYRNMIQSYVEIGDPKNPKLYPIFAEINFTVENGLTIQFNPKMKPFLLNFENGNYTRCFLEMAFELSSRYSLKLLELMLQYRGTQKNKVVERRLTPEELRFSLDVDEKKYKLMQDFIKKVINPAIRHINERTNYHINPDYKIERGRWRKIKAFIFTMTLPEADAEAQPKSKPSKEDVSLLDTSTTKSLVTLADKQSAETVTAELPTKKNEPQLERGRQEEPKKSKKKITDYSNEELKTLKKLLEIKLNKDTALELVDECGIKAIDKAFKEMNQTRKKGVPIENPAGFIRYKTYEYFNSANDITEEDIFARVAEIEEDERQEQIRLREEADKKKAEEEAKQAEEEKARLATRNQFSEEELLSVKEKISQEYMDNNKTFTENMEAEIKKYGLRNVEIISFAFKKSQANVKLRKKEKIRKVEENLEVIKPLEPLEPLDKNFIEKIKANYYQNGNFFSPDVVNQLQKRGWSVSKFQTKYMLNS